MQRLLKASVLVAAIALVTTSLVIADSAKQNQIDEWNAKGNPTIKFASQADVNETEPLNDDCPGEVFNFGDVVHGELTADDFDIYNFECPNGFLLTATTAADGALPTVDTVIELWTDNCTTFIASNDDNIGLYSEIQGTLVGFPAGTNFQLLVRGFSASSTGNYQLSITCEPPPEPNGNDSCEVAIRIPPLPALHRSG